MENKKISSQYPSRSYGNRQQPEKKVKKAESQNIFARSGRAVKKKFRVFSIRAGMDMPFFLLIMVILCIGLVMLFSASYANAYYVYGDSYYFIKDQALFMVLGIIIMILVSYFDYHHLHKFAMPILGVSFLLLVVVLFQPAINQVHRWVQIGTFSFQASEVTKFAIVLSFAHLISINFKRMDDLPLWDFTLFDHSGADAAAFSGGASYFLYRYCSAAGGGDAVYRRREAAVVCDRFVCDCRSHFVFGHFHR